MIQAQVEERLEAKLMLRRIARVRLYYWYKKKRKEKENQGLQRPETYGSRI